MVPRQACMRAIVIGNNHEFDRGSEAVTAWTSVADLSLIYGGDRKLTISPFPPNMTLVQDIRLALNWKRIDTVCPASTSSSVSDDIARDERLFQRINNPVATGSV